MSLATQPSVGTVSALCRPRASVLVEEAFPGLVPQSGVVDVGEEPVCRRVPGVAVLPVVAARRVASPAARRCSQRGRELAAGPGDAIDERAYGGEGCGARESEDAGPGRRVVGRDLWRSSLLGEHDFVDLHRLRAHSAPGMKENSVEAVVLGVELAHGDEHVLPALFQRALVPRLQGYEGKRA